MLAFIGIGVVMIITVQIAFHIAFAIGIAVKENERDDKRIKRIFSVSTHEDEREKLIKLKSSRIGYTCAGLGFITALATLALGCQTVTALHILLGACALGSVAEGAVSVYFYEKGVRNG